MNGGPTTDALVAKIRGLEARMVMLEDAIEIYGPPPKVRRLPLPEITPAQREFLVWLAVFGVLSVVTASRRRSE
jgi:hypothetical protein